MAEDKEKQKQQQNQNQNKNANQLPKNIFDNYIVNYDGQEVELHINYCGTVLKLQGTIRSRAKFDVILEYKDGRTLHKVVINKTYIIMAKPL